MTKARIMHRPKPKLGFGVSLLIPALPILARNPASIKTISTGDKITNAIAVMNDLLIC